MIVNNGAKSPNYSQRNNKFDPSGACNVSAGVSALAAAGWGIPITPGNQPEDDLYQVIHTNEKTLKLWKSLDPNGQIPPNQWFIVLSLGINIWMGKEISEFRDSVSLVSLRKWLGDGGTALMSGKFPTTNGHFVAVTGYQDDDGNDWMIKDPWGDYRTGYKIQVGNNITMPSHDFATIMKPVDSVYKRAILIKGV